MHEIDRHNQELLAESPYVRRDFLKKLADPSNLAGNKPVPLEQYQKIVEEYRRYFRDEIIGHFDHKLLPFNARSRKAYESRKWTGYEVVLDVFPDVIAYGVLLLPKDLKPGEKRPVVVCQHGLEGRPHDVIDRQTTRPTTTSPPSWPNAASSPLRRRTCTSSAIASAPCTQGQSHQENAVLGHRAATSADCRLAQDAAERRSDSGSAFTDCSTAASRPCAFRRW